MSLQEALRAIRGARRDLDKAEELIVALRAAQEGSEPVPEKPKAKKKPVVWATIPGLNLDAWMTWLKYRKEMGKPTYKTQSVARWLVRETDGIAKRQELIVQQSIDKEWSGLFPLKTAEQQRTRPEPERSFL